jgi:hypothetical protein
MGFWEKHFKIPITTSYFILVHINIKKNIFLITHRPRGRPTHVAKMHTKPTAKHSTKSLTHNLITASTLPHIRRLDTRDTWSGHETDRQTDIHPQWNSSGGGHKVKSAVFGQEGVILEWRLAVTRETFWTVYLAQMTVLHNILPFLSSALETVFASLTEGEGNAKMWMGSSLYSTCFKRFTCSCLVG